MSHILGMVTPVPREGRDAYLRFITEIIAVFRAHGATGGTVAWADDLPAGAVTSFPLAVKATPDEGISFAWVTFPSREVRERATAAARSDPRFRAAHLLSDHDGKRMLIAGFDVIHDTAAEPAADGDG